MYENNTDRQIPAVEWMYDESFVANMYDSRHTVACMESCRRPGVIFNCAVIVAVLDFLKKRKKKIGL